MVRNLLFSFHDLDFLDSQGLDKNLLWVQPGVCFSLATNVLNLQPKCLLKILSIKITVILPPYTVYVPFHFEGHFSAERRRSANIFILGTCLTSHPSPQGELSLASNFLSLLHNPSPLRGSYQPYTHGSSYSLEEMAWNELLTPSPFSLPPYPFSLLPPYPFSPPTMYFFTLLYTRSWVLPDELSLCGLIQIKDPSQPWGAVMSIHLLGLSQKPKGRLDREVSAYLMVVEMSKQTEGKMRDGARTKTHVFYIYHSNS